MLNNLYNKFRRITTNQLYFPEIDGIRFLAIILVMLFHTHGYFVNKSTIKFAENPDQHNLVNTFLWNGDKGVNLFFVLSGFILCLPFAHHYINKGKKIILKKYYLRRLTRLEPPYFIAMTAIFIIQVAAHIYPPSVLAPHWLASLAYAHELIYHRAPMLTVVAWSLEIEIQFYLVAPFIFRLLALHKLTRRFLIAAVLVSLAFIQTLYPPSLLFKNAYGYAQFFLAGVLLADFYVSDVAAAFFRNKWIIPIACLCFLGVVYMPVPDYLRLPFYTSFFIRLCSPLMMCVIYYAILKNNTLKSIFSYKFIPIIGGMCYSIYLLHYTIISIFGKFTIQLHLTNYYYPNLLLQIFLLTIPVLIISSIFYLYIERPFMSKKWVDKIIKKDKHLETANMQSEN